MRFFSTHSTQQNKTPGRACYSTRCFVVCPNSIPIKNGVFGLYSNGGGDGSRTRVREGFTKAFSGRSLSIQFPASERRQTASRIW